MSRRTPSLCTMNNVLVVLLLSLSLLLATPSAFVVVPQTASRTTLSMAESWDNPSTSGGGGGSSGKIEQIEFKIFPDGRVEETVRGIKGNNCEKVVEGINEQLGEVVASSPTEEMFEQEVVVDQTLYNSDSSDWSSGGNTW